MKNIIISVTLVVLSFFLGYSLHSKDEQNNHFSSPEKTIVKELASEKQLETKIVETLPSFIKEELQDKGFDPLKFDKTMWNNFLRKIESNILISTLQTIDKRPPIHTAVKTGNISLVEKLLNAGIDINQEDEKGIIPVFLAIIEHNNREFIEFLVENGADIGLNKHHERKEDALNLAIGNFITKLPLKDEIVDYLLENGFEFKKKHVENLLRTTHDRKNEYLKTLIDSLEINEKYLAKRGYLEFFITRGNDDEIISYLIERKIDLYLYETFDKLIFGASKNNKLSFETFKKLVSKKSINTGTGTNVTPLMFLAQNGDYQKIEYLLKNGADISIKTSDGKDVYSFLNGADIAVEEKEKIKTLLDSYTK